MANLMKRSGGDITPTRSIFPTFFNDFDRLFDNDLFLVPMHWNKQFESSMPAVNIKDKDKEYVIEVASPGMKKEDFNIDMQEGTLTISSQKEEEKKEEKENYMRREYNYSSFSRSFNLPDNVKPEEIKAYYKDGVLSLSVPKKESQTTNMRQKIKID